MANGNDPETRTKPGGVLSSALFLRAKPSLVELIRNELADCWMHPVTGLEEDPMRIRDSDAFPKHVFQRGGSSAIRMGATGRLRELLRVAKQEQLFRGRGRSHRIRKCHLARFINE